MNSDSFNHHQRSQEEQQLHERVIRIVEQHMLEQDDVEVFANPGNAREYPLVSQNEETIYPDLFTKAGDSLTAVCAVETPSTVSENSIEKWQTYSEFAASFLLVVPEQCVDLAQALLDESSIDSDKIILYQESAS